MRAAIVHYWLINQRGGERVVDALCRLLPEADVFTLFCDRHALSPELRRHRITTSFLNPLRRHYRSLLPLMPMALENLDLRGYDLIVSSESGPAKGILPPAGARHVCYCHTPMRYLWSLYPEYRAEFARSPLRRALMTPLANYLRLWDYSTAARVDTFVANSRNVQNRIWKTYRRESEVVYPPVEVESFHWQPAEDFFLVIGALVDYKRIDTAVRAFRTTGQRLRIVGTGPELRRLRSLAGPATEFLGNVDETQLRELYARCRALIVPGEEDFGMTAVEALASGKPVIALGRGGALESIPVGGTSAGVLYDQPTPEALRTALSRFEAIEADIHPAALQHWASRFSSARFAERMAAILNIPVEQPAPSPLRVP